MAPASLLQERPGLYSTSRRGLVYRSYTYWLVLAESFYISVALFFPNAAAYWDSTADFQMFGASCMTCCLVVMIAYCAIETRSWVRFGNILDLRVMDVSLGSRDLCVENSIDAGKD